MKPFQYVRPTTLEEVFSRLARHGRQARLLAGGTDLIVRLRKGDVAPEVVVDIKRIPALGADITTTASGLRVGSLVTMAQLAEDDRIRRHFPALVEAANVVGSVQIRTRATLSGNICNASPAADTAPALLAYGATVNLVGIAGSRRVPLTQFFVGPGQTVMTGNELVESIDLPVGDRPVGAAFGRITRRRGVDLATISLCCLVTASGHTRLAFGAVGPRPFLTEDTTGVLADSAAELQATNSALDRLIAQASPITDVRGSLEYRWAMLRVASRRALATAGLRLRSAPARG